MPLIDLKAQPSRSLQRWFGLSLASFFLLLCYLSQHSGKELPILLFSAAVVTALTYYLIPRSQIPIIRGWQYLTFPLAFVVGHVLLGVTFFGLFLPIGFVLRLRGYDPLKLRKQQSKSDWQRREPPPKAARYYQQF